MRVLHAEGAGPPRRDLSFGHALRMRHARAEDLDRLEPMLVALRGIPELRERRRGTFYRGSRAFLHFHEDPAGLFADVRLHDDFQRVSVTTRAQQRDLVARIRTSLADS